MKTVKQLRDERGEKLEKLNAITATANQEKRELKPEEVTEFDGLETEIRSLDEQIKRAEIAEQRNAEAAASQGKPLGKLDNEQKRQQQLGQFSFLKAIRSLTAVNQNDKLTGFELEMHEEAEREARASHQTINGVGIPSIVMKAKSMETRDNSVTMPTQPADGSAVVQTQKLISMEDMLRNALMTHHLGATYYSDLAGNVDFVRMTERPVATWKPEVGNLDKSNVKFGPAGSLTPNRIGTYTVHSFQFLRQTAPSIEAQIRQELAYSVAEGIDRAAILGDGLDNEPTGILNASGVTKISMGANGGAMSRQSTINALGQLLAKNVNGRNLGWLINGATAAALLGTPYNETSDRFVMEALDRIGPYPVALSNTVPSNGTKGTTTTETLSKAFFGAWENLYIAQWGGYDLMVNPYTLGKAGQVELIIQAFADILVYEPKAFVVLEDIDTTLS
ncbi:phage major capsid protein [Fibrisoma montanum]|uniref:Phage major capsid protein n=1 Tax=Fibrisoma montanum TaxID=2305895 RepID=A0A418M3V2_9BACT|nr:phage major capsid protein [Fibrisoma montanum]RIV20323.1 phage major capsid protein [Fibrisoma montanum]